MTSGEKMIWAAAFVAELDRRRVHYNANGKYHSDWLAECSYLAMEHADDVLSMAQDHLCGAMDKYVEESGMSRHLLEMLND